MKFQPPIIFRYDGDSVACDALRGQGARVMHILENLMSFRHLDQYNMTLIPYPGASIHASKVFGRRVVTINAGGATVPVEPSANRFCLCNCNFTVGYIDLVHQKTFEEEDICGEVSDSEKVTLIYDVLVCWGERTYKLFSNILASDFTPYSAGEKVMLIPYNEALFTCCTGVNLATGCKPKIAKNDNNEDGLAKITDEEFLSTLRIIPWCGFDIKKYYLW